MLLNATSLIAETSRPQKLSYLRIFPGCKLIKYRHEMHLLFAVGKKGQIMRPRKKIYLFLLYYYSLSVTVTVIFVYVVVSNNSHVI